MSFGGGGGGMYYPIPTIQTSSTNTSTNIPDWLTKASMGGISAATNILNRPTAAYGGDLAPSLTEDQKNAGSMIRNSMGLANPYYDTARGAIGNAMQLLSPATLAGCLSGINQYMNPYISNVVDSVRSLGQQNLNAALTQTADQAIGAKAFGGSRHGVQEGIATAQNNRDTMALIASLLQGGYNNATNMLNTDITAMNTADMRNRDNALAGGKAMADIGTTVRSSNASDINNLLTYGSVEQNTNSVIDKAKYDEWLRQQQDPFSRLRAYNETISTAPHSTSGTSNTTSVGMSPQPNTSSSPLMQGLGAGLSGLSTIGSLFYGGPTSAIAGMRGLLS
jgi:hypothetical protein